MIDRILYNILILVFSAILLTGCTDDLLYSDTSVGDGESSVSLSFDFRRFDQSGSATRSAGDSYDRIRNIAVLVYDETGAQLQRDWCYYKDLTGETISPGENYDDTKTVDITIPYGKYQFYAVANMGNIVNNSLYSVDIGSVESLKALPLEWKSSADGTPGANDQMFGYFVDADAEEAGAGSAVVTVNRRHVNLESWLTRASSKVTVAFDASSLKEGVTVYIRSLAIKKLPKYCSLGNVSKVEREEDLLEEGESLEYPVSAVISRDDPFYPAKTTVDASGNPAWSETDGPHSHTNEHSLFFFENMQGSGPSRQLIDSNNNAILDKDERFEFQEMPYATYIEVDAYFNSVNQQRPGVGRIKYRYMLGNGSDTNYDAVRNHAYRLTLRLNGFANDYDWHMELEKFLHVPEPRHFNYMGKSFYPDSSIPNYGYDFRYENELIFDSYELNLETEEITYLPVKVTFSPAGQNNFTENPPSWLNVRNEQLGDTQQGKLTFTCDPLTYDEYDVATEVNKGTLGSATAPYNLAGTAADSADDTANTYIVGSKGYYILPLVYGNARSGGKNNTSAYSGFSGDRTLATLVNYKNEGISDPYILTDIYKSNVPQTGISASLLWEDVKGLVTNIRFDKNAYGGKGGIYFEVPAVTNGGNAVIAIKDPSGTIMWSWQIWVTFSKLAEWTQQLSNWSGTYALMPVNLGWAPQTGEKIRNYVGRSYDVKIENGTLSRTITIVQEPHLAVTAGTSPYYQWGRKDPFFSADGGDDTTKEWWAYDDSGNLVSSTDAPVQLNNDFTDDGHKNRPLTKNILDQLIQKPMTWNNPNCSVDATQTVNRYKSDDVSYINLWTDATKTVYDPCPVGFQVSPTETYVSFLLNWQASNPKYWYNVPPTEMLTGYTDHVIEFYTGDRENKMTSISFSECGYRDYDQKSRVIGYSSSYVWTTGNMDNNTSHYSYAFLHIPDFTKNEYLSDSALGPTWGGPTNNGIPVRPTAWVK